MRFGRDANGILALEAITQPNKISAPRIPVGLINGILALEAITQPNKISAPRIPIGLISAAAAGSAAFLN